MKTTKRILAILLATLLSLGVLAIAASASDPTSGIDDNGNYWKIFYEYLISSPDHDLRTAGASDSMIWCLDDESGTADAIFFRKPGRYTVQMAPGITEVERTTLYVSRFCQGVDITLRDVHVHNKTARRSRALWLSVDSSAILRLEGENRFTAWAGMEDKPNYGAMLDLGGEAVLTIEGPGSLEVDTSAWPLVDAIGSTLEQGTGPAELIINSGTVTAYGGRHGISATSNPNGFAGLFLTVNGGTLNATGKNGYGIGNDGGITVGEYFSDLTRIETVLYAKINGGVVSAKSMRDDLPDIRLAPEYSFTNPKLGSIVTWVSYIDGDAVVFADRIENAALTRGIVFANNAGTLYGGSVTVTEDVSFPAGSSLTVPAGRTLAVQQGKTVNNLGSVTNSGTILANFAGYGNIIPAQSIVTPPADPGVGGGETRPTAKRTFFQWLMIIFLFGWLWMK